MKKLLIPVAALCGVLAIPLLAQDKPKDPPKPAAAPVAEAPKKNEPLKVGATVDEKLTVRDIDGKEMTFKDLRGKVVFIHFWSTMCPYEKLADPKTVALAEMYKGKDVVCLAIDANSNEIGALPAKDAKPSETYTDIRKHLAEKKMSFPVYADHGNKLADLFGAQHTPHCFVINQKGVLVYAGGLDDDSDNAKGKDAKQYVKDAIDQTLAGKEVTTKTSEAYGCGIKRMKVGA
jgi:thiol-disulfide isomerase/thioredoxin